MYDWLRRSLVKQEVDGAPLRNLDSMMERRSYSWSNFCMKLVMMAYRPGRGFCSLRTTEF